MLERNEPRLPKRRRRRRVLLLILILLSPVIYSYILCPSVWYYRWFNPHKTSMMDYREDQAKERGKPFHLQYEYVPLAEIAPSLRRAIVMAEDGNFYKHHGLDFDAIRAAYKYNKKRGRIVRGASTISQQLAKNLWLSPKQSYWRKMIEAILTVRLELALPKDRILELYLNIIEWGDGVFGVKAASMHYFHTLPRGLSPQQSALLVAAVPSPLRSNPGRPSSYLQRRQRIILGWLLGRYRDDKQREDLLKAINDEEQAEETAEAEAATPTPTPTPTEEEAQPTPAPPVATPEELPDDLFAPLPPPAAGGAPSEGKASE